MRPFEGNPTMFIDRFRRLWVLPPWLGGARRSQEEPEGARSPSQEEPGGARPGGARMSQEKPRGARMNVVLVRFWAYNLYKCWGSFNCFLFSKVVVLLSSSKPHGLVCLFVSGPQGFMIGVEVFSSLSRCGNCRASI